MAGARLREKEERRLKRILVLGSAGMAGHTIALYFQEAGYDVTGFSLYENPVFEGIVGDATDAGLMREILQQGDYDAVINCIGILNQFAEQNHAQAVLLNAYLPHMLAGITAHMRTRVVHMSTDCVFSGKKGAYAAHDLRDGETFYDRSKALGELEDEKNVTLRNSIIGPDINENGIGLFNWFMKQQGEVNGYTGAVWTGQTTLQLAKTMEQVLQHGATGLYNAVPERPTTKYELLRLFNRYVRGDALTVHAVEGVRLDKSLIPSAFPFDYRIPDYETMVREMAQWIRDHRALYPHYEL